MTNMRYVWTLGLVKVNINWVNCALMLILNISFKINHDPSSKSLEHESRECIKSFPSLRPHQTSSPPNLLVEVGWGPRLRPHLPCERCYHHCLTHPAFDYDSYSCQNGNNEDYSKNPQSTKAANVSKAFHRYALNYINALNYLETLRRQQEFSDFEKVFIFFLWFIFAKLDEHWTSECWVFFWSWCDCSGAKNICI